MADTAHLEMTKLAENPAQPDVTVNESLVVTDGMIQLRCTNMTQNSPPGSPGEGDRYIIGSSPSGDWSAQSTGDIALYLGSSWHYIAAGTGIEGWLVWDKDTDSEWRHDGTDWIRQRAYGGLLDTVNTTATANISMLKDRVYWNLGQNLTVTTVSDLPASGQARVTERIVDVNTYTITWPSSGVLIDWGTAGAPSLTNNKLYWFRFIAVSATKVLGYSLGEFTP